MRCFCLQGVIYAQGKRGLRLSVVRVDLERCLVSLLCLAQAFFTPIEIAKHEPQVGISRLETGCLAKGAQSIAGSISPLIDLAKAGPQDDPARFQPRGFLKGLEEVVETRLALAVRLFEDLASGDSGDVLVGRRIEKFDDAVTEDLEVGGMPGQVRGLILGQPKYHPDTVIDEQFAPDIERAVGMIALTPAGELEAFYKENGVFPTRITGQKHGDVKIIRVDSQVVESLSHFGYLLCEHPLSLGANQRRAINGQQDRWSIPFDRQPDFFGERVDALLEGFSLRIAVVGRGVGCTHESFACKEGGRNGDSSWYKNQAPLRRLASLGARS